MLANILRMWQEADELWHGTKPKLSILEYSPRILDKNETKYLCMVEKNLNQVPIGISQTFNLLLDLRQFIAMQHNNFESFVILKNCNKATSIHCRSSTSFFRELWPFTTGGKKTAVPRSSVQSNIRVRLRLNWAYQAKIWWRWDFVFLLHWECIFLKLIKGKRQKLAGRV